MPKTKNHKNGWPCGSPIEHPEILEQVACMSKDVRLEKVSLSYERHPFWPTWPDGGWSIRISIFSEFVPEPIAAFYENEFVWYLDD